MVNPAPAAGKAPSEPASIRILGVKVTPLTVDELHAYIGQTIAAKARHLVLNVNVHCLNLAFRIPWLKDFLNSAPVVFCDGAGVMWAARLQGKTIPERITYADWMWQLAAYCESRGHSLYFLGARAGVAEKAAAKLRARYPGLIIKGCRDGFFPLEGPDNEAVVAGVNASGADILVLGLGMPRQEEWLRRNWGRLNPAVALTGGACFDFVSGEVPRCPRFMADHSLEWLYRLWVEPRRMFGRYVLGNPLFMLRVLRERRLGRSAS
jgi:N-acetylglucosaminyldiphosphoundecaprenol N-acetyl-beta-D-mannosaminyltransferase